jgi:Protein-tyrosine-phosphatase
MVMVMEPAQRQHLGKVRPAHIGKVVLLSQPTGGGVIDDPMGKDEACFREVYQEIADLVDAWLARFGVG